MLYNLQSKYQFFFCGLTAPSGPVPLHCQGFKITFRHHIWYVSDSHQLNILFMKYKLIFTGWIWVMGQCQHQGRSEGYCFNKWLWSVFGKV